MNLAYYELLGDAAGLNTEIDKYLAVDAPKIHDAAKKTFVREQCSTLYYLTSDNA
jgi:hypothetical protein